MPELQQYCPKAASVTAIQWDGTLEIMLDICAWVNTVAGGTLIDYAFNHAAQNPQPEKVRLRSALEGGHYTTIVPSDYIVCTDDDRFLRYTAEEFEKLFKLCE